MARLPRLSLPAVVHYVLQRGHNAGAIVRDAIDTEHLLQTLREAALLHGVVLHAYAVLETELRVLATPDSAAGASLMMQAVGRRYAARFNRRHQRSGALWDGRFRSALIEPGAPTLLALRQIDGLVPAVEATETDEPGPHAPEASTASTLVRDLFVRSSGPHRIGGRRDVALVDPAEYWQLGNTPFDRESHYRRLLAEPIDSAAAAALMQAVQGAWAWGSEAFLAGLASDAARPVAPRPRGRPRRPV